MLTQNLSSILIFGESAYLQRRVLLHAALGHPWCTGSRVFEAPWSMHAFMAARGPQAATRASLDARNPLYQELSLGAWSNVTRALIKGSVPPRVKNSRVTMVVRSSFMQGRYARGGLYKLHQNRGKVVPEPRRDPFRESQIQMPFTQALPPSRYLVNGDASTRCMSFIAVRPVFYLISTLLRIPRRIQVNEHRAVQPKHVHRSHTSNAAATTRSYKSEVITCPYQVSYRPPHLAVITKPWPVASFGSAQWELETCQNTNTSSHTPYYVNCEFSLTCLLC